MSKYRAFVESINNVFNALKVVQGLAVVCHAWRGLLQGHNVLMLILKHQKYKHERIR